MMRLEDLKPNMSIRGLLQDSISTVVNVVWYGTVAIELTYKNAKGNVSSVILYRHDESRLEIVEEGRPWSFDGNGQMFRLVSEAHRIRLAHLFDPLLAVHTSDVEPLPHQITAVYEEMLPRQPLRFLLADDAGAGKTIMAGLLIRELIARGDLERCLIVCPGSLAEQWQNELYRRFQLAFEIMTNDKLKSARTGNWFLENNLVVARLDMLSRNVNTQAMLEVPDAHWDLVVCDEAHKMSASFFGGEIKYTKRYQLGRKSSSLTRHFLLMTATPHNGKEEDFQLFMALIDRDRFEGRFRDGVHTSDTSDLMRRMVKEKLFKFDCTRLFPKRIANTVSYHLSDNEANLYKSVTDYVREEFNRAAKLQNGKRAGTVGFALTILQRRLASSPEAIYQSLLNRRANLKKHLQELEALQREQIRKALAKSGPTYDEEDLEDLQDAPDQELEDAENQIVDQATAARTIDELKAEINTLADLVKLALKVRRGGEDRKWRELAELLHEIFTIPNANKSVRNRPSKKSGLPTPKTSSNQKLVIFTEYRDTLTYLFERVSTLLNKSGSVVIIHGRMNREDRMKAQEAFWHDPVVKILIATDAAGEGINLQRAHLMVNYDLPWNPNRIEQRFGRIHRIGQTEVCFLWNLVANETREGNVYHTLLEKLEKAREALGGQVFDVLGKVVFEGKPLRELLIEAIRFGEKPEIRKHLTEVVEGALDQEQLRLLLEDQVLAPQSMDVSNVRRVREDMERAEARKLQPYYIESFFLEAFKQLEGKIIQREHRRYEAIHVPASVRRKASNLGSRAPVLSKYKRIVFEKNLIAPRDQPLAAFICPGHPLLDATLDLTLEHHRDLLRRGAILVDERDLRESLRILFFVEHAIKDGSQTQSGQPRIVSKQMLYVEMDADNNAHHLHYAPYLDYRPLKSEEPKVAEILQRRECEWIDSSIGDKALTYAITHVIPSHLSEVKESRQELIARTKRAVKERLNKEIRHWNHRADELKLQEQAGKINARLNAKGAQRRAEDLQYRLDKRLKELQQEANLSALLPNVIGGILVVPLGFLAKIAPDQVVKPSISPNKQASATRAREIVMEVERELGFEPFDRESEKLGYDIESRVPDTGRLRFIEVKGRTEKATSITVTKNEILYSLNKPDNFILAIVEFKGQIDTDEHQVHYVRNPFQREPDFDVTSVNYNFAKLLERAEVPR